MTPPPGQPRYQTGAYGPPMPYDSPPRALSVASFALGLVSVVFGFTFIVPILGLIFGVLGLRREPAGRGFALAGLWINAIMLGFVVLIIIVIVVGFFIFGIALLPTFLLATTSTSNSLG